MTMKATDAKGAGKTPTWPSRRQGVLVHTFQKAMDSCLVPRSDLGRAEHENGFVQQISMDLGAQNIAENERLGVVKSMIVGRAG